MFKNIQNRRRNVNSDERKPVYSYYSKRWRDDDQSIRRPETSKSRNVVPRGWWRHLPSICALIIIFICIGYTLSLSSNPKIVQNQIDNSLFLHDKNTYASAAHKLFNSSIFNHNKVTVDINGISAALKKQFPELADVSITLPLINRAPIVYITPSQPALKLTNNNQMYLISESGEALINASQVKDIDSLKLPDVIDETGADVQLGSSALPASEVSFIESVNNQLGAKSISVKEYKLIRSPNEVDVFLSGSKYYL